MTIHFENELAGLKQKLLTMASHAERAVNKAIEALIERDDEVARNVIPRCTPVDVLNTQLHRELSSYMVERPSTITRCLNLMVISKGLERVADHATNVAEEVVYVYEGRDIRPSGQGAVATNA